MANCVDIMDHFQSHYNPISLNGLRKAQRMIDLLTLDWEVGRLISQFRREKSSKFVFDSVVTLQCFDIYIMIFPDVIL